MPNTIVINTATQESRVAVLERGVIKDFFLERRNDLSVVGNIYKGRVLRVLPGMQAAFVDIGLEKAGFLYVADVHDGSATLDDDDSGKSKGGGRRKRKDAPPIEKLLKQGQDVIVQVVKEPIGTKGARVTGHISLPGRHLVFMPTVEHLGISRQIASEKERKRLRKIAQDMRPAGGGFIVRTAAEGVPSELLRRDMQILIDLWNDVIEKAGKGKAPKALHEDLDVVLKATRDLATEDVDALVVDTRAEYDRIMDFVERVMPGFGRRVKLYVGKDPIFDAYGIEAELQAALGRRADLPSGGYLIIEKTEALTSIDVNTGRFVGDGNKLEETIVQTNVEAAREIAYQLKLRGIGGLIIIDFIDMEDTKNRAKVERVFQEALTGDKGRVKFGRISEFGIMEMTRKRTGERLVQSLSRECDKCGGTGIVATPETVAYEVLREFRRTLGDIEEHDVKVACNNEVANILRNQMADEIREFELRYNKNVVVKNERGRRVDNFDISGLKPREANQGGGRGRGRNTANDDAKANGSDAKANGSDAKANGSDAKANDDVNAGGDAKANGSDAKANGSDAKANGSDAKANGSDAKANGSDAKANDGSGNRGRRRGGRGANSGNADAKANDDVNAGGDAKASDAEPNATPPTGADTKPGTAEAS